MAGNLESDPAVKNFQNYLRIRSVHPNINYDECINFLRGQAEQIGLPVLLYEPVPKKPVLIMSWAGTEPNLPSILLNSHMDVVPVFEKSWTHPPFEAQLKDGVVYGRGAQDMKSVGIQYLEAVRRLKAKGIRLKRTVHLSFVSEEEVGGACMQQFVKTEDFKKLNVGFSLDEGIASATDDYRIFNGERTIWHMKVICPGKSGHGSLLLPDNSGEKIRYIIDKMMDLRSEAKKQLADHPEWNIGDVTTVNLTILSGGIQDNVVPEKLVAVFDIRIALSVDQKQFEDTIKRWCVEAGDGVTYEFLQKDLYVLPTKLDDTNPYWLAFKAAADQLKITLICGTFTGGTDSRYLRELGIPAIGFSPMNRTVLGLHEHDERLSVDVFLRGIDIYETIIPALANV